MIPQTVIHLSILHSLISLAVCHIPGLVLSTLLPKLQTKPLPAMHVGIGILRMDKVVISHNPQFDFLSHEPYRNLSAHTAPIIQPQEKSSFASGQTNLGLFWQFYQANRLLDVCVL